MSTFGTHYLKVHSHGTTTFERGAHLQGGGTVPRYVTLAKALVLISSHLHFDFWIMLVLVVVLLSHAYHNIKKEKKKEEKKKTKQKKKKKKRRKKDFATLQ